MNVGHMIRPALRGLLGPWKSAELKASEHRIDCRWTLLGHAHTFPRLLLSWTLHIAVLRRSACHILSIDVLSRLNENWWSAETQTITTSQGNWVKIGLELETWKVETKTSALETEMKLRRLDWAPRPDQDETPDGSQNVLGLIPGSNVMYKCKI